jgi:hypothetical protein
MQEIGAAVKAAAAVWPQHCLCTTEQQLSLQLLTATLAYAQ